MTALPRQLDLVADTVLAADPRWTQPSILLRQPSLKHTASSTVDARIAAIDGRRRALGISNAVLCRHAGVEINNWHRLRRGQQLPTPTTLQKLEAALSVPPREKSPPQIVKSYHAVVAGLLADRMGFPRAVLVATDFSKQRPENKQWLQASRIRMMATYITAVELQVENTALGRALGCTRQNIKKVRDRVEDLREDPAIDAVIAAVTDQVTGRA